MLERYTSKDDALFWIDCDTEKHEKGFGQTIAACSDCNIAVHDNGLIVVTEEQGAKKTRVTFACKF